METQYYNYRKHWLAVPFVKLQAAPKSFPGEQWVKRSLKDAGKEMFKSLISNINMAVLYIHLTT